MLSGIEDANDVADKNLPPRSLPSSIPPTESSVTIPTPATEHAPKGYIIDDSARGTIFWEADRDDDNNNNAEPKAVEEDDSTGGAGSGSGEAPESDADQQSLGHPFQIEWLSTEKLPFHRARGLRNPWNQNREVKIARDGVEIEPSVGRRLVNLFHSGPQPAGTVPSGGQPQHAFPSGQRMMPPLLYPVDPRYAQQY